MVPRGTPCAPTHRVQVPPGDTLNDRADHPRYGWLVGFVVFLSFTLTIGIAQYSFGVFVTELEHALGWTRTEVSIALSLFAMMGVAALPVGWLLDRFGSRPVMAVSLTALAVSQLLRPWMTDLWQFYALNALQFAAVPGAASLSGPRLVGVWFHATRGRAMGLTAMGANFGGIVFSSLTALLIGSIGWRSAYVVYGVMFLALVPVVLYVIHESPPAAATDDLRRAAVAPPRPMANVNVGEALRSRTFYLVVAALLLAQITYQSVLPQIVPHLESVGISRTTAAAALSTVALFGGAGKVVLGWFCERRPARIALIVSLLCQVVGMLMLLLAGDSWLLWLSVPVFGFGFGSLGAIQPLLVQETFGMLAFSRIFGLINFLTLASALIGPPLVGASFDVTHSYQSAFLVIAALFMLAAGISWFARPVRLASDRSAG